MSTAVCEEVKTSSEEMQLVVFELNREFYGVDIGDVNTIVRMQEITQIPNQPHYVEGIINLRGAIVPIISLRKRFNFGIGEMTKAARIMVVERENGLVGLTVDAVTETLRLSSESVEPPSNLIRSVESDYVYGVAKLEGRLVILLDLDKLIAVSDVEFAREVNP